MEARRTVLVLAMVTAALAFVYPVCAEYHPTLGRFMQRDPIGYQDGMNLYEYERSNPLRYRDPYGLKVVVLEVPNVTREVKGEEGRPVLHQDRLLKSSNARIDRLLETLRSQVTSAMFREAVSWGMIKVNGEVFRGSLQEFTHLVKREKKSRVVRQVSGGYEAARTKLRKLAREIDEPYDELGIAAHGCAEDPSADIPVPTGHIQFNDRYAGKDTAIRELRGIGLKAKGKFAIISCLRKGALKETHKIIPFDYGLKWGTILDGTGGPDEKGEYSFTKRRCPKIEIRTPRIVHYRQEQAGRKKPFFPLPQESAYEKP